MTALRVAVVKPDWGIRGGFEMVVERLLAHMANAGHRVQLVTYPVWPGHHHPFGRTIESEMWDRAPEFFGYLVQAEKCAQIRLASVDLVVSTQPPSFMAQHPRHISLFYHHLRSFYDLGELLADDMPDRQVHRRASAAVRHIDNEGLHRVSRVLAGSETVRDRLARYNNLTDTVDVFHAGPSIGPPPSADFPVVRNGAPLCISRHEFPKRTELFVAAMHLSGIDMGVCVGSGGRLGMVKQLHHQLSKADTDELFSNQRLGLNPTEWIDPQCVDEGDQRVVFQSDLDGPALQRMMLDSLCLVAPAYDEDYGLTAIEAMQHGLPVVTCTDSGHLATFVEHGVTGLVVEPTASAIAAALRYLAADRSAAAAMGAAARLHAAQYSWARATGEFDAAIERVMS